MIVSIEELKVVREKFKDKKIVLALGSFDLFHWEHLNYLNDAKKLGDVLVVAVKDDVAVSQKDKSRPVITEKQRIEIVDNIKSVDYCVLVSLQGIPQSIIEEIKDISNTANQQQWWELFYNVFESLKPDVLYFEENMVLQPHRIKAAQMFNFKLESRPRTERVSTTKIIDKIRS